jgi:hypothetical protein
VRVILVSALAAVTAKVWTKALFVRVCKLSICEQSEGMRRRDYFVIDLIIAKKTIIISAMKAIIQIHA